MDIKLIAKPLAFVLFAGSGSPFDRRVSLGSAREATFGPVGRSAAGFRRLGGRADVRKSTETTRWTRTGVRRPVS
jgi:hypothetical protein